MQNLYKKLSFRPLRYHEAWFDPQERQIVEHWGIVGRTGETRNHDLDETDNEESAVGRVLAEAIANGFRPFPEDDHQIIVIEYIIDGFGDEKDLAKRHSLEEHMNHKLGWNGLGHCDGGSIGSGTMEVCCIVVDYEIAKSAIARELKNTAYADYSRIYDGMRNDSL